jgi:hypothetical protein
MYIHGQFSRQFSGSQAALESLAATPAGRNKLPEDDYRRIFTISHSFHRRQNFYFGCYSEKEQKIVKPSALIQEVLF